MNISNIITVGILVLFISCGKKEERVKEQTPKSGKNIVDSPTVKDGPSTDITYPLDSLLSYNSEAELKKVYGGEVKRSTGYLPEGMGTYHNTLLFPGTENQVEFVWKDDTVNMSGLNYIRVSGGSTDWKTSDGITIGMTLKELEEINQKPFYFYGFGWDYSGTVHWNSGYLDQKNIAVNLEYPGDVVPGSHRGLLGDHRISSDSELAQKVNPVVREISLRRNHHKL